MGAADGCDLRRVHVIHIGGFCDVAYKERACKLSKLMAKEKAQQRTEPYLVRFCQIRPGDRVVARRPMLLHRTCSAEAVLLDGVRTAMATAVHGFARYPKEF